MYLANENPFVCNPLDSKAINLSPGLIFLPSIILFLSTTPVTTPTKSCAPAQYVSGISAVSPPTKATLFLWQAFAKPFTKFAIFLGSILSLAI